HIVARDGTQAPFASGLDQGPNQGSELGRAQRVTAQEQRGDLPDEIVRHTQAPAIRTAPESEVDLFQLLIAAVAHSIAQSQQLTLDKEEMRSVLLRIMIHIGWRRPVTTEELLERGHRPEGV